MSVRTDQILVEQAKSDPQAFAGLYDQYFRRIYAFIYLQTHDTALTKDITAATFEKALRHLHQFEWREITFAAWLYRIALAIANRSVVGFIYGTHLYLRPWFWPGRSAAGRHYDLLSAGISGRAPVVLFAPCPAPHAGFPGIYEWHSLKPG